MTHNKKQARNLRANMDGSSSPVSKNIELCLNPPTTGGGDTTDEDESLAGSNGATPANLRTEFAANVEPRRDFTLKFHYHWLGDQFGDPSSGQFTPGVHAQSETEYGKNDEGRRRAHSELKMGPEEELVSAKLQPVLSQAQNKALTAQRELDNAPEIKGLQDTNQANPYYNIDIDLEVFQHRMKWTKKRCLTANNFNPPPRTGNASDDEHLERQARVPRGMERAHSASSKNLGVPNPFRTSKKETANEDKDESGSDVVPQDPSITDNDSQGQGLDESTNGEEPSLFDEGDAQAKSKPRVRVPSAKVRESVSIYFESMSTKPQSKKKRGRGRPPNTPATERKPKANSDPKTDILAPIKAANAYISVAAAEIARQKSDEAAASDIGNNYCNHDGVDLREQTSKASLRKNRASMAMKNITASLAPLTDEASQLKLKAKLAKRMTSQTAKTQARCAALDVDVETGISALSDAQIVNTTVVADTPYPSIEESLGRSSTSRGRSRTPRSYSPPTAKKSGNPRHKLSFDGTEPITTHQRKKAESSPCSRTANIADKAMKDTVMGGMDTSASQRHTSMSSRPATPAMKLTTTPHESKGPVTPSATSGLIAHYNAFFPQKQQPQKLNPCAGATINVNAFLHMADSQALQSSGPQIQNLISQRSSMSESMRQALARQIDKETKTHRHNLATFGAVLKDADYKAGEIDTSSLKVREQPRGEGQGGMGKGGYTYPPFDATFASTSISNGADRIANLSRISVVKPVSFSLSRRVDTPKLSPSIISPYTRTPGLGGTPVLGSTATPVPASPHLGFPIEPKKVAFISPDSYAGLLRRCLSCVRGHTLSVADIYEWFEENTDKPSRTVPNGYKKTIRDALRKAGMFLIVSGDEGSPNPANEWKLKREFVIKGLGPDGTGIVDTNGQPIVLGRDESLETNIHSCISRMPERCLPLEDIYAYFQVFVPDCFRGVGEEEWKKKVCDQLEDSDAFYLEERSRDIWAIHPKAILDSAGASQLRAMHKTKSGILPKPSQAETHAKFISGRVAGESKYKDTASPSTFAAMIRTQNNTRGADQYYINRNFNQSLAYSHLKPMDGKQSAPNHHLSQNSQRPQIEQRLASGQELIGQMRNASAQILQIEQKRELLAEDLPTTGGDNGARSGMGPQPQYGQGAVDAGGDLMMSAALGFTSMDTEALEGDCTSRMDNLDPGPFLGPNATFDLYPDIQLSVDANDDLGQFIDKYVGNYQPNPQDNGQGGNQELDAILFGNTSKSLQAKQGESLYGMQVGNFSQGAQLPQAGTSGLGIVVPLNPMLSAGVGQSIARAINPVTSQEASGDHKRNLSKEQMLFETSPVVKTNIGPVRVSPSLLDAQLPNNFHGEGGNITISSALEFKASSANPDARGASGLSGAGDGGVNRANAINATDFTHPDLDLNISAALQNPNAMTFANNKLYTQSVPLLMLTSQGGYHYDLNLSYHDEPYFDFLGKYKGPPELEKMVVRTPTKMIPNAEWSIEDLLDHAAWGGEPWRNLGAAILSGGAAAGDVGDGVSGVMGGEAGQTSASGAIGGIQMGGGNAGDKETGAVAPVSSMPGARLYPVFPCRPMNFNTTTISRTNSTAKRTTNPYQRGAHSHILQHGINSAHPDLGSLLPQKDQEILDAMSLKQMNEWYSSNLTLQVWAATRLPLLLFPRGTSPDGGGGDYVSMGDMELRRDIADPSPAEMQAAIGQGIADGRSPMDFDEQVADSIKIANSVPDPLPTLKEALANAPTLGDGEPVDFVVHKFDKPSGDVPTLEHGDIAEFVEHIFDRPSGNGNEIGAMGDAGSAMGANAMMQRNGGGFGGLDDEARKGAEEQLSASLTGAFDYERFNGLDFGEDA